MAYLSTIIVIGTGLLSWIFQKEKKKNMS